MWNTISMPSLTSSVLELFAKNIQNGQI